MINKKPITQSEMDSAEQDLLQVDREIRELKFIRTTQGITEETERQFELLRKRKVRIKNVIAKKKRGKKDITHTLAYQMFGKPYTKLSPDEKRKYDAYVQQERRKAKLGENYKAKTKNSLVQQVFGKKSRELTKQECSQYVILCAKRRKNNTDTPN